MKKYEPIGEGDYLQKIFQIPQKYSPPHNKIPPSSLLVIKLGNGNLLPSGGVDYLGEGLWKFWGGRPLQGAGIKN